MAGRLPRCRDSQKENWCCVTWGSDLKHWQGKARQIRLLPFISLTKLSRCYLSLETSLLRWLLPALCEVLKCPQEWWETSAPLQPKPAWMPSNVIWTLYWNIFLVSFAQNCADFVLMNNGTTVLVLPGQTSCQIHKSGNSSNITGCCSGRCSPSKNRASDPPAFQQLFLMKFS